MAANTLYKDVLLNHFRHPRNRDDLDGADAVCRAINTLCGDEIEVGIFVSGDNIEQVRFRGRGCSICIASASMMTEAVAGHTDREAKTLCADMDHWFSQGADQDASEPAPELEALSPVRAYPARRRCVLLAWEALSDALAEP